MSVIEIYVDQVWAGSGKLVRRNDECRIEDCGAQFCDDNDESIKVYDLIEEAIEAGKKSITVELDGESQKITWTVTESDEDQVAEQVFKGKNYTITSRGAWFILDDMVNPNQEFDSFEELVASHPVCEESRTFFFGVCPVGDDDQAISEEMISELCVATTRNEAGRHFTEWMHHVDALESAGLVRIDRPVHDVTGIPYDEQYWSIEVTEKGMLLVDQHKDGENETEAQQLIAEHPKAADLMTILDNSAYPSDQDWELGQTTWTLDDGSKIRICGNDVEAIADEPEDEDEDDSEDVLVGATKFALTNSETGEQCEYTANDLWTAQMLAAEDHGGEPGDWTDGESEPVGDDELGGSQVTIRDIALQFDRLCPSQVDTTISGNGHQESGHVGHDTDGVLSIGWYCAGGNAGESLCEISLSTIEDLYKRLASLPDGSLDDGGIDEIVREFNGKW
jgi:hypothetical protein